jgi:YidC/Oxa1 family membrane protein insertase
MTPQQPPDSKNLYAAIALCLAILLGWQFFILGPREEAERKRLAEIRKQQELSAPQATQATPGAPGAVGAPGASGVAGAPGAAPTTTTGLPRQQALAMSGQRIVFDTPSVDGSISVRGARIDDLKLKAYRETLDKSSPEITLLTPKAASLSYFAEFGWTAAPGANMPLPGADTPWQLSSSNRLAPGSPVTLTWDNGQGLRFTRVIAIDDQFMFTIADSVENTGSAAVTIYPYAVIQRHGLPKDHVPNWILHEGGVGMLNGTLSRETYYDLETAREVKAASPGGWLGITDKYWLTALIPPQGETMQARYAAMPGQAPNAVQTFTQFQADYLLPARTIAGGAKASVEHKLFAGAKVREKLEAYSEKFGIPHLNNAIDWGWFWFITWPFAWLLEMLNKFIGNFGVAILALTVIIKAVFFPLANKSYEAMSKMKKIQPEVQQMQTTYKDDRVKLQQEMMALYRREKINPLVGCLPILIQIPVFFSLYKVLFVSIEMRHAPFFGWIQDLAAHDPTSIFNLFGLLPFALPASVNLGFMLFPLHIGVWPILMGITMWVQMKMNPPAQDPTQQAVLNWMPWIFTPLMALFPAGLMIYWVWNNLLSIAQQYFIMRKHGTPIEIIDNFKLPSWINRASTNGPNDPPASKS